MDTISKDSSSLKAIIGGGIVDEPGDDAVLHYQVVTRGAKNTLLKIKLETGRFHQIRAQLSAIGHPIMGDSKYGSKTKLAEGQIALCATDLEFTTTTTNEAVKIHTEYPLAFQLFL